MATNISFNYLYRDAGNFKIFGTTIFRNKFEIPLTEIESQIQARLISEQYFIPEKWGIQRLSFSGFCPELDHEWHEFESLSETDEPLEDEQDISLFLEEIDESKFSH